MKPARSVFVLFLLLTSFTVSAFATCTPGTNWTAAWTDLYGQTTYALEGPCKAYLGVPFDVTATVTDNTFSISEVGYRWSINDNGTALASGKWLTVVNGKWQRVIGISYTGVPTDHRFDFNCTDLGQGGGSDWSNSSVGGTTSVDAFPPAPNKPPAVDAGTSIFLLSENQGSTVVQGTASDSDGDALTYRWLEGSAEVQSSRAVDASGVAALDLAALPSLSIGEHTFVLEVCDGTAKSTDSTVVSVENSAPVATVSGGGTFNPGDTIRLSGNVADFDGDLLSYQWAEGDTVLAAGQVATARGGDPVALPETLLPGGLALGAHMLTLKVTDGSNAVSASVAIDVVDTTAPTLSPVPSTSLLWPPNGKMTEVTIKANARDNSGGPVLLDVLLTTNQPRQVDKDGRTTPDWSVERIDQGAGVVVLRLKNARSGKNGDTIYTVSVRATDSAGNASTAQVSITAPHDKRRSGVPGKRPVLSGAKADAAVKSK